MDFFDKLGEKVSKTYNAASEKTANFAKETKLRMEISENKSKIEEQYKIIGEKFYASFINRREEDIVLRYIDEFKTVDQLKEQIKEKENEILSLKDKKKCAKCGEEYDVNSDHCPKCGEKENKEVLEGEVIDNNNNN